MALVGFAMLLGGCAVKTPAPVPSPNLPAATPGPRSIGAITVHAPTEAICSRASGAGDLCITGFFGAFSSGLYFVLHHYYLEGGDAPDLTAEFTLFELSHSLVSAAGQNTPATIKASLRWSFTLRDKAGATLVALAETTDGPERFAYVGTDGKIVLALENAVIERIGSAIAATRAPEAPLPAARACVPGTTQACLGPAACTGAQSCLANGSGFDRCDCGRN